jgi:hypothetical protein
MNTRAGHLTVSELRERIARLEGHGDHAKSVLPFEIPELDARLPDGGLAPWVRSQATATARPRRPSQSR